MDVNNRIVATDTVPEMITKMSEGNPGCIQFLLEFITIIPEAFLMVLDFDSMGLYGSKLYMLWNDCCDRSVSTVADIMRRKNNGEITAKEILEHVSGVYGTPFMRDDFKNGSSNDIEITEEEK